MSVWLFFTTLRLYSLHRIALATTNFARASFTSLGTGSGSRVRVTNCVSEQ